MVGCSIALGFIISLIVLSAERLLAEVECTGLQEYEE